MKKRRSLLNIVPNGVPASLGRPKQLGRSPSSNTGYLPQGRANSELILFLALKSVKVEVSLRAMRL